LTKVTAQTKLLSQNALAEPGESPVSALNFELSGRAVFENALFLQMFLD
jgi:hypothetical protein